MESRWGNGHRSSRVQGAEPGMCTEEERAGRTVSQFSTVWGSEVPVQTKKEMGLGMKTSPEKLPTQPSAPLSGQEEGKGARIVASVPELLQWTPVHVPSDRTAERDDPRLQKGLTKELSWVSCHPKQDPGELG